MPPNPRSQSDTKLGESSKSSVKRKSVIETTPSIIHDEPPFLFPPGNVKARDGLPPGASLAAIFRYYMGIESDQILVPKHLAQKKAIDPIATGMHHGRRAVNLGIYNRAIREEHGTARSFLIWSFVINAALGLQITFAAILTALGASGTSSDLVAVFGTLNTIIAGFLTYLKGTGLPMRMKYYHNQWLKLRAYIEQRERDFAMDDHSGVHHLGYAELVEEVHVIEAMYQNIRKDIEKHTPDNFGGKNDHENNQAPGEGAPPSVLATKGLSGLRNKLSGAVSHGKSDLEHGLKNVVEDLERRVKGHLDNHMAKIDERTQVKDYGATDQTNLLNETDGESEEEPHDVSEAALARMKQTQTRALEAKYQAEARIKELEDKLAALNGEGGKSPDTKDEQS